MVKQIYATLGSKYIVYNRQQPAINIKFRAIVLKPLTGKTVQTILKWLKI